MKTRDKYRFTLQWGAETAEKIQAGDFLESLGNRKSELVVLAVTEYLAAHPETIYTGHKPKIIIKPNYTREQVEALIRSILDEQRATAPLIQPENDDQHAGPTAPAPDVDEMLKNLDLFSQ